MEVSGQLHALVTLLPGRESTVPIGQRLDGPQSWSEQSGKEKKILSPAENRTLVIQTVA